MRSRVRGEHTPGQPTPVKIARGAVNESAHVVTPISEARQTERQSAAKFRCHRGVCVLCIATPMQRVALASGPGAPSPDDVVSCGLTRNVRDSFVVAQRIEIVFVESRAPRCVKTV